VKEKMFIRAKEIADDLGVSKPFAYKLVREMNEELKARGFITISGRVSRQYYEERFYGKKSSAKGEECENAGL